VSRRKERKEKKRKDFAFRRQFNSSIIPGCPVGEQNKAEGSLTCHEAVHMEEGHDHKGLVLWSQLIGGNDVGQAGCQVALVQWHTLQAIVAV